jgi:hypothetical protein
VPKARLPVSVSTARKNRGLVKDLKMSELGKRKGKASKYNAKGCYLHRDTALPCDPKDKARFYFHSASEAERFRQLVRLRDAGLIDRLVCQPKFPLVINGTRICEYRADFQYEVVDDRGSVLGTVVEDVKGMVTDVYDLKNKMMRAAYPGLRVHEIPAKEIATWEGRTPID